MAESDPYEEWKAQGRPGGSFANWMASQAPAPAAPAQQPPAAPAPQPQAQSARPAPAGGTPMTYEQWYAANGNQGDTGGYNLYLQNNTNFNSSVLGQGGTGTQEQRTTGASAAGSFADDSADAGNSHTGDPYLDELRSGRVAGSEDWRRFSNAQLKEWQKYYVGGGKFRNKYGDIVDKPDDTGPNTPRGYNGTGDYLGGGGDGGGGGGGGGASGGGYTPYIPPPPPKPVTFGNQLSMTGNPMQDMLIQQFNTGQDPTTFQNNIFGLGEDFKVGGTGVNADGANKDRQGQSLSGGGLWWGQGKDTFKGFDASQKNAEGAMSTSPAAPKTTAEATPAVVQPGGETAGNTAARIGGAHIAGPARPRNFTPTVAKNTGIAGMAQSAFANPARNKPSYF